MKLFEDRVRYFQEKFGLMNWTIILVENQVNVEMHHAKTLADPRYNRATITVYPLLLTKQRIWDETIVHELVHIVMALYDFFADNMGTEGTDELFFIARENSVSVLTSIIMRLLNKNEEYSDNLIWEK